MKKEWFFDRYCGQQFVALLEDGKLAIGFETEDEDEEEYFKNLNLLTAKPVIYAANVGEEDLANDGADNAGVQAVREYAKETGSEVFAICAQIEHNEIDLVIFLRDPMTPKMHEPTVNNILRLCDMHNIPVATNLATSELLIKSLDRGDLDWREMYK